MFLRTPCVNALEVEERYLFAVNLDVALTVQRNIPHHLCLTHFPRGTFCAPPSFSRWTHRALGPPSQECTCHLSLLDALNDWYLLGTKCRDKPKDPVRSPMFHVSWQIYHFSLPVMTFPIVFQSLSFLQLIYGNLLVHGSHLSIRTAPAASGGFLLPKNL